MAIHWGPGKAVLLAVLLTLSLVLAASAACPKTKLVVLPSSVTIDNAGAGALTPGMAVVMSVRVDFPDKENTTYPETSQLELTTGLDNPAWTWYIVRNGVKKDETGEWKSRVIISGDVLAWPANTTESLEVELYGTAPPVMENKKLTVMRIQDIAGTTCIDNVYRYDTWVLNTSVTKERIAGLYKDLGQLRADAAEKQQDGADTFGVMTKIDEAQRSLDEANAAPVFEFVSVGLALDRAESAIADGRRLLAEVPVPGTTTLQQAPATGQKATTMAVASPLSLSVILMAFVACAGAVILRKRHT